ncbi:hypothetical protein M8C21_002594, partial [Ambrosia artemisiifolia]
YPITMQLKVFATYVDESGDDVNCCALCDDVLVPLKDSFVITGKFRNTGAFFVECWALLLLPRNHEVVPSLQTPARDHLLFLFVERKRKRETTTPATLLTKRSNPFGNAQQHVPGNNLYCLKNLNFIVQQHLMKYKKTYRYDAVFALGFVTVYDHLMDGYPSDEDREAIFQAYVKALNEDPQLTGMMHRNRRHGRVCKTLILWLIWLIFRQKQEKLRTCWMDIAQRAGVDLFRLLELSNATEPTILKKLCASLNINKKSVDRDLDVYRNLLSKLVQAKELLKEYVESFKQCFPRDM